MIKKISTAEFQKFLAKSQTTEAEQKLIDKIHNQATPDEELLDLLEQVKDGKYTRGMLYEFYSGRETFSKKVAQELASVAEALNQRVLLENILRDDRFTDRAHTIALDYVIGLENM